MKKKLEEKVDKDVLKYAYKKTPDVLKDTLTDRAMRIEGLLRVKKDPIIEKNEEPKKTEKYINYDAMSPERAKEFHRLEKKKNK